MGNLQVTLQQLGTQSGTTLRPTNKLSKMRTSMVTTLVSCLGLVALASAKFCPGERNGNKCVAGDHSYKCAVFFENLTSKRPLTWIGALPDALKKASSPEEVQDILGADVTEESFSQLDSCDVTTANARCYSILNDQKDIKLDSCDKDLINTGGSTTVGDYLCGQVRRWLRNSASFKSGGIRNLRLPFYYSACNGDWTPITDGSKALFFKEPLCCTSQGLYEKCDGTPFNSVC